MRFIIKEKSSKIYKILQNLKEQYDIIGNINNLGFTFSLDIEYEGKPAPSLANSIVETALFPKKLSHGLIITQGGLYDNMIMMSPPIFIKDEEINLFGQLIFSIFEHVYSDLMKRSK